MGWNLLKQPKVIQCIHDDLSIMHFSGVIFLESLFMNFPSSASSALGRLRELHGVDLHEVLLLGKRCCTVYVAPAYFLIQSEVPEVKVCTSGQCLFLGLIGLSLLRLRPILGALHPSLMQDFQFKIMFNLECYCFLISSYVHWSKVFSFSYYCLCTLSISLMP